MSTSSTVQLVAIVGGSGAGKGWLVVRLCRLLGERAGHLQLDDFYRDRSHLSPGRRARINFDRPAAIDWEAAGRVLRECRAGRPTRVPSYDFATNTRNASREHPAWQPRPIVLVDGLWLLRPPAIRRLFDLKIFLDTPTDLRCSRRLARDVAERGYTAETVERQLRTAVVPMHDRFVEPQKKWADVVVRQPFQEENLLALADRLWALLTRASLACAWTPESFRHEFLAHVANHEYCN
jgi:uridine kinase